MKNVILILMTLTGIYGCNTKSNNTDVEITKAKQAAVDSMKQVNLISQQQRQIDSLETAAKVSPTKAVNTTTGNAYTASSRNTTPSTPVSYASTKKKKKMGNVAKGAIIGAGVGAITGAVVSKKKGQGAIVGGVLGAGAGAGVGAVINKKQKQKENVIYFR